MKAASRRAGVEVVRSLWYKGEMDVSGRVRAVRRLLWFAVGSWLVVGGAVIGVVSRFPLRWRRTAPHIARWARLGARCLGVRARVCGQLPAPGSLIVANHVGYVDVVTIGSIAPCIFAARHDMRSWPLFGQLARSGATIFINRDSRRAGARGIAQVTAALGVGATVIGFPEGTSAGGPDLLPFRTGLFQAAVDSQAPVVPAVIRYTTIDGAAVTRANLGEIGWFDGGPFFRHLLTLAGHRLIEAEVTFGSPIPAPHADRRNLAAAAEEAVRGLLIAY